MRQFLAEQAIDLTNKKVLVALSGGVDSVVLLQLLHEMGVAVAVAHMNFQLRADAEDDAAFCQALANRYQLAFHQKAVDTKKFAADNNLSIQEAARDLRYAWFEDLMDQQGYDYCATAHHLDDQIETVLLQLTKGCGLEGLAGIPVVRDRYIRPLLFADKVHISGYAEKMQLHYREDSSNTDNKYQRNLIRNEVIPVLRGINPRLSEAFAKNATHVKAAVQLQRTAVQALLNQWISGDAAQRRIDRALLQHPQARSLLHYALGDFGFNAAQQADILQQTRIGAEWQSPTHRLLLDREALLLAPVQEQPLDTYLLQQPAGELSLPDGRISWEVISLPDTFRQPTSVALLALDALQWPLQLRQWQPGDRFQPFGQKGQHQKISDYLVNAKMDRFAKEKQQVLCSGKDICWLVGQRIDERFRVSTSKGDCLKVEWTENK